MKSRLRFLAVPLTLLAPGGWAVAEPKTDDSPADRLPPHITRVTRFGERADWSHDGKRILFLFKTFGDAMELDVATSGYVDLWKLRLDGGGTTERLTHFSDTPGYKASNPVVSDDGRFIAFQMARSRDAAGVGHGIFVLDLGRAPTSKR